MAETHELRLKIDAAAAKRGSREFVGAINAVKAAVRDLERDSAGAFTKLKNISPKVDVSGLKAATREANNVTKAQGQAERASERVAAEMKRVALSSSAALRTSQNEVQRLTERFTALGNTDAIDRLNRDLVNMKRALTSAQSGLDVRTARSSFSDTSAELKRLANDLEAESRAHRRAADAASHHSDRLETLAQRYDPIRANSMRYARALSDLSELEEAGMISAARAAQARQDAAQSMLAASAATDQYNAAMKRSTQSTQQGIMVGHQLSDVLITSQMGFQSVAMISLQQGSQLAAQMQALKASGGSAFRTLLAGFTSLVNPLSLITIGAVAAGAAVAKWFFAAGEETRSFSDSLSDAESRINELRRATDTLAGNNLRQLREEYGHLNTALDEHLERLRKVAELEAGMANADMIASIRDGLTSDGNLFTGNVDAVRRAFETTNDQARNLLNLMNQVKSARTFEQQAEAVTRLRQAVESTTGGLDKSEGTARGVLVQLVRAEDAAMRLMAAQNGVTDATGNASGAASNLTYSIGTAADEAARLLANLNGVPSALAVMGKSVEGQIASIRAQNKALNLQITDGLSGAAANRRVQLDQMVTTAADRGQHLTVDQIAPQLEAIEALDAAAKKQEELRKALSEANRPARKAGRSGGGGGSRKAALSEEQKAVESLNDSLTSRLTSLQAERIELELLASGQFQTAQGAAAMAEAMTTGKGQVDQQTEAMIRQIDAAAKLNEELRKVARDPVKEWMDSVPNWIEAGQQIEMGAINSLRDSISEMIKTGKFDIEALGDSILGVIADIVADKAVAELANLLGRGEGNGLGGLLGGLFNSQGDDPSAGQGAAVANGGVQAGQHISTAMMQAGQTVSQQLAQAMTQGGQQAGQFTQQAHAVGGQQAANATRLAGVQHGQQVRMATTTSGGQHATRVRTAIEAGGQQHASMVRSASAGGIGGGGGFLDSIGGAGGLISMAVGAFSEGGFSDSPVGMASAPIGAFQNAPHFSEGTPNTSGIPAILHGNEAVVNLTKGRKIPVELNGGAGANGGQPIVQHFNWDVHTPDADSFRRSSSQISADMARAGSKAVRKND
ncbi:phage tail tape measure C-terminal domain-containing protein [Roseovarius sp. B08]|uniref:phage tail tape measure C-terminal domain-containing protein n=1 Tax=Roseovarius sp. B08 TaxID=3449223 RepID=UPI003EDC7976